MKVIYGVVVKDGVRKRCPIVLTERKCEACGVKFEPKTQRTRFCSKECSRKEEYSRTREHAKERSRMWYSNHKEEVSKRRKAYYWADPEKWRKRTQEYYKTRKEQKRCTDESYKDKVRHGGKRKELLEKEGYKCSRCGVELDSFNIVAHHDTFNPKEHDHQSLLCRSCHIKVHKR